MKLATLAMKPAMVFATALEGCILETEADQKEERWKRTDS